MNKLNFFHLIPLLPLVLVSGCAHLMVQSDVIDTQKLLIADLPSYQPGEYFIYDSGLAKIAVKTDDTIVHWKYGNDATSRGFSNFLIPPLSWKTTINSGESSTDVSPSFLWPLRVGSLGVFTISQSITDQSGAVEEVNRTWECRGDGFERVSVPAGNFDTYVIPCNRYAVTTKKWRGRTTYYYSPEIMHYVKIKKEYTGQPAVIEQLTRYGFNSEHLPKKEQNSLQKTLNKTLEAGAVGKAAYWSNTPKDISAMLIPYQPYDGLEGQQCREYRSVYNVGGRVHQHTRKACKAADGSWQRANR